MERIKSFTIVTFMFIIPFIIGGCQHSSRRPNVILIMTDDQGYGDLACLGNPIIKTPQLDKLYKESIHFTNFHVNSFCAPTRAALMTGRMSDRTHVWSTVYARNYLSKKETTMAEFFKASGYNTAHFGKWHLGYNYPYRSMDRGFDRWVGQGGGVSSASDYWGNDRLDDHYLYNGKWKKTEGFSTDIYFDETMKFIKESKGKPFFVYLPTYVPHGPMNVLKRWREYYAKTGMPPRSVEWGDTWDLYASITRFDYNLGRLRNFLKKNKLDENTLLIFTTDNGTADGFVVYNAGMRGHKGSSYEGGHRVPMFMYWPAGGLNKAEDIDKFTWHFDLLPTLIDLCHLKTPERGHLKFDGRSLKPLLYDKNATWSDRTVFMHTQNTRDVPVKSLNSLIATKKWRLINGKELYDIKSDPGEKNNVASENKDVVKDLLNQYDKYWDELKMTEYPYPRPIIGTKHQEITVLSPEEWVRDSEKTHTWNQRHVIAGVKNGGFWPVNIPQSGKYQFEVRRWPVELNRPIESGLPEKTDSGITRLGKPVVMAEGKVIPAKKVRLEIGEEVAEKQIKPGDVCERFEMNLEPGDKNIRAWLIDSNGDMQGAYYIYAKRIQN